MARAFPKITSCTTAFRFALEAERACADLAAAAEVLAPDDRWQARLEELVCTHDDRVEKLETRQPTGDDEIHLDGAGYLGTLESEPQTSWPAVVEQLCRAEEDTARFHEDFGRQCEPALGDAARLFRKAAEQSRAAAESLRRELG